MPSELMTGTLGVFDMLYLPLSSSGGGLNSLSCPVPTASGTNLEKGSVIAVIIPKSEAQS